MSKSLQDRIADAISEIGAHILLHGRDMYGETVPLAAAQDVLRDCAAALKKSAGPPQKAPEPVTIPPSGGGTTVTGVVAFPPSAVGAIAPGGSGGTAAVKVTGGTAAKGRAGGA
jgi:hypothetical protein